MACRAEPAAVRARQPLPFVRLLAEASTEVGLAPLSVQELCTACEQTLHVLSPSVPACLTDLQAVDAFISRVSAAMVALLDRHISYPSTHDRLRKALSQACQREALRHGGRTARSWGLTETDIAAVYASIEETPRGALTT